MKENIGKWYSDNGILGITSEMLNTRLGVVNEMQIDLNKQKDTCIDMIKCFMNMKYNEEELEEFKNSFIEADMTFSASQEKEIRLLSGIYLCSHIEKKEAYDIALMIICISHLNSTPENRKIFQRIEKDLSNYRIAYRKMEELKATPSIDKKIIDDIATSEQDDNSWSFEKANLIKKGFNSLIKNIQVRQENVGILESNLEIQKEESNILWWLMGGWSNSYNMSFKDIDAYKSALIVPIELIKIVAWMPGPIAIRNVINRMLNDYNDAQEHAFEDYINSADEIICKEYVKMNMDKCLTFTPILQAIICKNSYGENLWVQVYEKDLGCCLSNIKFTIQEFSYCLYEECELFECIEG